MRCDKAKNLLRSDYLDGEVGESEKRDIAAHLASCQECRGLERELLDQRALFGTVKRHKVPGRVWDNISDAIAKEHAHQDGGAVRDILGWLRELTHARRPVLVLAGAFTALVIVLISAGAVIRGIRPSGAGNGAESYADYRISDAGDDTSFGLGTNLEDYFL